MKFFKVHVCGNDFIVINNFDKKNNLTQEQIIFLCKNNFGIGSSGLVLIEKSDIVDFKVKILNIDSSESSLSLNGIMCAVKIAYEEKITQSTNINIETKSGIRPTQLKIKNDILNEVQINIGKPLFMENPLKIYNLNCISVGNLHAVMIVKDLQYYPVKEIGPIIENDSNFPDRINVEFVEIINKNNVNVRVWERGCGETLACGSGACATVAVLNNLKIVESECNVNLKGGSVNVRIIEENIFIIGKPISVFSGEIDII